MSDIPHTRIPEWRCPNCHYKMDAATDAFGEHQPKEGDVSICLNCGSLTLFNKDLTMRLPTAAERVTLTSDPRITQAQITAAYVTGSKKNK